MIRDNGGTNYLSVWLAVMFFIAVPFGFTGYALSNQKIPLKTQEIVESLNDAEWQKISDGLRSIRVITPSGIMLSAFGISPEHFDFEIVLQDQKKGNWANELTKPEGALIVTNGGFFAERPNGELYSVGYLKLDGQVRSRAWKNTGGFISFLSDGLKFSPAAAGIPNGDGDVLQSKPMMIEPGGKWAMRSNLGQVKHRSILCRMDDGEILLTTITRGGLSVYEAGWVMRDIGDGGYFGCDSALALDGGRSTQIWFADKPEYSFPGLARVHSFLMVKPKSLN